ncbi:MAG: ATP-grasp domain-containing protein [Planctomycetes bacterium]|nr:ATP-grasp domain-containing protein [Planctomycetota bacterium]
MHIFLYEWITGGGLVEEPGPLPASMLAEGAAMVTALAADFVAIEGARVTLLRDMRLDELVLPGCEVIEIHSASHRQDEVESLAGEADHTLVIAPEFDDILLQTLRHARQAGGQLLSSTNEFVKLTADKQRTALHLAKAGVPVPDAVVISSDEEKLPADFFYPAVLKPVCGAGSQHTLLVSGPKDEPPPYPWPRRLERYCPGIAVSVAMLCGPSHRTPLPACRQHLSSDGRFTYRGGSLIHETDLARRATLLADCAMKALPPAIGYVGVDLVLGKVADGSEDYVIEVNPRMTTSYVGLRAATNENLAAALIENAAGRVTSPKFHTDRLEFSADGMIRSPGEWS